MFSARNIRKQTTTALGVSALLLVGLTLTGCSVLQDLVQPEPVRDETGEVVEGGQSDVFTVSVGDCLSEAASDGEVSDVPIVPCSEPHDAEIYHDFELDGTEFPGDEEVTRLADEGCLGAFEDFVGVPFDSSTLEITYYTPTEGSWNEVDDRLVSCMIMDPAGPTTDSLEGAGR
jgi:Septum formation